MLNKLSIVLFSLIFLISCSNGGESNITHAPSTADEGWEKFVQNRCIRDDFDQGADDDVYGLSCIEGKHLLIKTSNKGNLVPISEVSDNEKSLKIDGIDFKNKFYTPNSYTILKGQADDKLIPFLLNFLPKDEDFKGSLDTEYRLIFKTVGDHLVLFKAVTEWDDLPYMERTSLQVLREGEIMGYNSSYKRQKGDYYIAPFIAYPIEYCKAETRLDNNDRRTKKSRISCEDSHFQNREYIRLDINAKKPPYALKQDLKKDLFPSKYFDGLWYFSEGPIEAPTSANEIAPVEAHLVELKREGDRFNLIDMSGEVEDRIRQSLPNHLPVKWLDFEMDINGNGQWNSFGERENKDDADKIKRPYAQINFTGMKIDLKTVGIDEKVKGNLIELTIEPDYLSYTHKITYQGRLVKWKTSYLRSGPVDPACLNGDSVDTNCLKAKLIEREGFAPRRWFLEDHKHVFGIMPTVPQDEIQQAENTQTELLDHIRMLRFNTSLNTEEERSTKTKTIKWHFSKNSTKDPDYRQVAERAIEIYDQAFDYLSKNKDTKIKVELVKEEEIDLGDLRYNVINLVKSKDLVRGSGGLLGIAPSYANPDTGQVIGATANILIHNQERISDNTVRDYIRYEIFQRDKRTDEENDIHVVSPYFREQIQEKCHKVGQFIQQVKNQRLQPRTELNDREIIISCGKELTKKTLLALILHELGHNFGLAHNFQASTDKRNYYGYSAESDSINKAKAKSEIQAIFPNIKAVEKIARFSSVMDYGMEDQLELEYLGKYDLAALRYLYLDEMELNDGSFKSLNLDYSDPKKQQALTEDMLEKAKKYKHCADGQSYLEMMCDKWDYGSNPKEIVQEYILKIKRSLNQFRYRYDKDPNQFIAKAHALNFTQLNFLINHLIIYYGHWLSLRNNYLINRGLNPIYILSDSKPTDDYKRAIDEGLAGNGEYALYHPVRQEVSHFLMEILDDLHEMKCHFTDMANKAQQTRHKFSLKLIKDHLKYEHGNDLYVEDCHSPHVRDFLHENDLKLIKQTGYENFSSYYPQLQSQKAKPDIMPISQIVPNVLHTGLYESIALEPDLLKKLSLKMQGNMLNSEKNQTPLDTEITFNLLNITFVNRQHLSQGSEKEDILREHRQDLRSRMYEIGTGVNSFYEKVTRYIEKLEGEDLKRALSALEVPFLQTAYEEYVKFKTSHSAEQHTLSFQNYLLDRDDTINDKAEQILIIPFKKDSFASKVITKYNENLRWLKELNNKTDLSLVEKLNKTALEEHQSLLLVNYINSSVHW